MIKPYKFKSLTFRIWTTFALFALILIFAISAIYMVIVRITEAQAQKDALQLSHEFLLEQQSGQAIDFSRIPFNNEPTPTLDFKSLGRVHHLGLSYNMATTSFSAFPLDNRPLEGFLPGEIGSWFFSFVDTSNLEASPPYKTYYKGSFKKLPMLFIITDIQHIGSTHLFLVSFIPQHHDNLFVLMFISIGFCFILIALLASKVISNSICRPLKHLQSQVQMIANKDWIDPIETDQIDEIGQLVHSINNMQLSLQKADQEERRFLQSISHDLKTPIMVIMGHAQAIIDGMYVDSLENTADIIKSEAARLENKVKQILYYNTLDYALENEQSSTIIDLSRLLSNMITHIEAISPQIEYSVSLVSLLIRGNADRIQIALENILDNQLRYAQSKIRIDLREEDEFAVLYISNNGPSIPEEHLPYIFEEFYKSETGKFGLGLTITKKIILFYGGSIEVSNESFGVLFKIKIPLLSAHEIEE